MAQTLQYLYPTALLSTILGLSPNLDLKDMLYAQSAHWCLMHMVNEYMTVLDRLFMLPANGRNQRQSIAVLWGEGAFR